MTDETPSAGGEDLDDQGFPSLDEVVDIFSGKGSAHPVSASIDELRNLLISKGFDEIQTNPFMEFKEVKALTGPVFPIFRDSIYHVQYKKLTSIPPTPQLEVRIRGRYPKVDLANLWNLIDGIDDETSAEDFMRAVGERLGLSLEDSISLMNLIPEITESGTVETDLTMRAFMPTAWIPTLKATYDSGSLPIRLFTVGQNYRREPKEDRYHLRTYNVFSLAIMDMTLDITRAKGIVKLILDTIGVSELRIMRKEYQFPYFRPDTEYEIFGHDIEVGTFGLIDEGILKDANIDASVLLMDIGVERLLMHREGYPDIRVLSFPQYHAAWDLSDNDLASSISIHRAPQSDVGRQISADILSTLIRNRDSETSKAIAWKGSVRVVEGKYVLTKTDSMKGQVGYDAEVVLKEAKEGMGLTGPAAFDEIMVLGGNIIGAPRPEMKKLEDQGAVSTGITYARAFADLAAWKVERALEKRHVAKRVEMVRDIDQINLTIDAKAFQYILSRKKKIDVRGPVFLRFSFRAIEE